MHDLLFEFVQDPSPDQFLALRSALVESEAYDPYSDEMDQVESLIEDGKWEDARESLADAMPNLILSPRAHLAMSYIAKKLGEEMAEKMEGFLASACCQGIIDTGEGTQESPYLVTRTSDEYDVLSYLEKKFVSQSLVEANGKMFDLIKCGDDSELWFDISDCYRRLGDQFS